MRYISSDSDDPDKLDEMAPEDDFDGSCQADCGCEKRERERVAEKDDDGDGIRC